ncbi:UDP-N-acetylglucosamine 4,6-dehydratase (inverting) [Nisaea sp.]|uniref:UDP-N-acetylglucosamine 4,6-dehydratase (inverting) n=1 Tax=Nisaea sp. TaxID=2024842 RepID=UPI0032991F4D
MSYQPFSFDTDHIDLNGKTVLVTGGTGSFGKEFVRTALESSEMRRCIVFSRDEQKHYDMGQDYPSVPGKPIRYFIGDVRDVDRLELAMRGVDYVVHAAAMKHVPAAEYNPFECVQTNIYGAENIVKAALRTGVKKVIALSTDKAANPINLYGATKLASDKIFVAANNISGADGCRFAVVRYGNVIGSRGSVIPFFQKLIDEGAPDLPITDERMTRFWITLQQGVNFVLSSMEMMKGREIFVPKIPSMKITDVAKTMAPSLPLRNVGIRPGEKLHEVMISEDDSRTTVELEDRYVILPAQSDRVLDDYLAEGYKLVPAEFRYASDTNTDWLSGDDLNKMMSSI